MKMLLEQGKMKAVIDKRCPLDGTAKAIAMVKVVKKKKYSVNYLRKVKGVNEK